MKQLKRLIVLDPIVLTRDQWSRLGALAEHLVEFHGLSADEILARLEKDMDANPAPMCWTQLAQENVTEKVLLERLEGADGVITCWTNIPDSILNQCQDLRYIGFWTNMAAHRINLGLAQQKGMHVTYVPDYGTESVAEMTFAGLLAVTRKILSNAKDTQRGKWPYELLKTGSFVPPVEAIPQRMLRDKTLGIIGFGRIGRRVAEIALAFGMKVQYWSRNHYEEWEQKGIKYRELDDLFATSDVVSLHLSPYAPEKIVSADRIRMLHDGAIFVNTSAGRLVDQDALLTELENRRLYAFLDVYEGLPPRRRFKNIDMQDNLFTYRAGWFTQEAITAKGDALIWNLELFLSGESGNVLDEQTRVRLGEDHLEIPCDRGSSESKGI